MIESRLDNYKKSVVQSRAFLRSCKMLILGDSLPAKARFSKIQNKMS